MDINVTTNDHLRLDILTYAIRGVYRQGYRPPPVRTVNLLLDYGIDMYCKWSYRPPLWEAIVHGNIDAVKALMDKGYDLNSVHGNDGTPIYCHLNPSVAKLLTEYGYKRSVSRDGRVNDLVILY